jgi:hypothetical protein
VAYFHFQNSVSNNDPKEHNVPCCNAQEFSRNTPKLRRNISPLPSGLKNKPKSKSARNRRQAELSMNIYRSNGITHQKILFFVLNAVGTLNPGRRRNNSVTCRLKAGILEPAYTEQLSTFPPQQTNNSWERCVTTRELEPL